MTDQTDQVPVEVEQDGEAQKGGWDVVDSADDFLAQFVALAGVGVSMPITLTVGGSLVTGMICGGKEYHEGIEAVLRQGWPELPDFVAQIFKDRAEVYDRDDTHVIGFIHLKDATIYNGGVNPIPNEGGVWWRGRIDAVTGWSFGKLQSSKN